jgi:outer membrane protein assembly factor BamD (BamD/ComL family)
MKFIYLMVLSGLMMACQPNPEQLKADLMSADKSLSQATSISDIKLAESFIKNAEQLAKQSPADSLSPEYLFKAAGVAKTIGQYDKSIALWDKLIAQYPEHIWSAPAAFLKGFTAENEMADPKLAVKYFKEFLEKYPKSTFVGDAQRQIMLLEGNKSPDEMVKEFEQSGDTLAPAE